MPGSLLINGRIRRKGLVAILFESGYPTINFITLEEVFDDNITVFFIELPLLEGKAAFISSILELL
jgi:hypothetical protein